MPEVLPAPVGVLALLLCRPTVWVKEQPDVLHLGEMGRSLVLEFWSLWVHGGMLVDTGLEDAEHLGLNTALLLLGSLLWAWSFTCAVTLKGCVKSEMKYVCEGASIVSDRYPYMELLFELLSLWESSWELWFMTICRGRGTQMKDCDWKWCASHWKRREGQELCLRRCCGGGQRIQVWLHARRASPWLPHVAPDPVCFTIRF